jgi:hypothetical protein
MFDINSMKSINYNKAKIEGGGDGSYELPEITIDENGIETMNNKDLYFYINDYIENQYESDLLKKKEIPFTSNGKKRLDEYLAILAMESFSNINKDGVVVDTSNKPYNVNAVLTEGKNDSYSIFQLDTGPALPYILMAMDPEYHDKLYQSWKNGTHPEDARKILQEDGVEEKMYAFLKDPKNIRHHLDVAATLWNEHERSTNLGKDGARAWNAYKDYNNKTKSNDWNRSYEDYLQQNTDIGYNYYVNELQRNTQRRREDLDDLKQFINMPKLGATIEEAINNFVEILEEASRSGEIPKKAAPTDNLKELGKMFKK